MSYDSLSSSLMTGTAAYRNAPEVRNKVIAEVGYAAIALIAAIETLAAAIFTAGLLIIYPFAPQPFEHTLKWLDSSAFCTGWAVVNLALNPVLLYLAEDESRARALAKSYVRL